MGKRNNRWNNGARRRKVQEKIRQQGRPCALCGRPIDYSLPHLITLPNSKKLVHPASMVIDEIIPVKYGGSEIQLTNCQPAHAACNAVRGAKPMSWVYGAGRQAIMYALPNALKKAQLSINTCVKQSVQKQQHDEQANKMSSTW